MGVSSFGQSLESQIDELLQRQYPEFGPGAAALVAKGDEIIYCKAFGKANLELDVDMRPEMVFRIASISKQFTAVGILMLVEQQKLSLEDDITKFLPTYPTNETHISLRHLLTHTSGISRSITQKPWNADIRKHDFKKDAFIDYFKDEPKAFNPGEAFQYNNFGYILLAKVIEVVSGRSYEDFMKQEIFQKLGMSQSRQANDSDVIQNRAYGYEKNEDFVIKEYTSPSLSIGAGSLLSTVADLHTWNRALAKHSLIKKETLEQAFQNQTLNNGKEINYGFGWFINEINGSPTLEHAGGDHGFRADAIYLPKEDVFVAVLSNCSCGEPRPLSTKIAALAIGKPYPEIKPVKVDIDNLYHWVGKYTFDDGRVRNVLLKGDNLYWVINKRTELLMTPTSGNNFTLSNGLTQIQFDLIEDKTINVMVKNRISVRHTSKPYTRREEIEIDEKEITKHVGRYNLLPEVDIVVRLENGKLVATATNQTPLMLYPESSNRFFFKAIDGHIEFMVDKEGKTSGLEMTQNGVIYPGKRLSSESEKANAE